MSVSSHAHHPVSHSPFPSYFWIKSRHSFFPLSDFIFSSSTLSTPPDLSLSVTLRSGNVSSMSARISSSSLVSFSVDGRTFSYSDQSVCACRGFKALSEGLCSWLAPC